MTLKEAESKTQMPRKFILRAIRSGAIRASKVGKRWHVLEGDVNDLKSENDMKIQELNNIYISLYWQGISVKQLQRRVESDFKQREILAEPKGYVEKLIYGEVMREMKRRGDGAK